jgi:site-specific recombinase XerD
MSSITLTKRRETVYVVYTHQRKRFRVSTRVNVEDQYWDEDHLRKNHPEFKNTNDLIKAVFSRVVTASLSVSTRGLNPTTELVRGEYIKMFTPPVEEKPLEQPIETFWTKWNQYHAQLTCRDTTKVNHKLAYTHMKNFETYAKKANGLKWQLTIDNLDKVVFGQFIQYLLLTLGMVDSSINKNVRFFKAYLHWAYPEKDFHWMKYTLMNVEEEVIALTEAELLYISEFKIGGYMEKTRDLFVFLATSGMRYSDSQLFDPTWVSPEQVMTFTQRKTSGIAIAPLSNISKRILVKYGGLPPQLSKNKFNDYLKDLFEEAKMNRHITVRVVKGKNVIPTIYPLHKVISSHTARRTFITLCLEKGMPLQDVMSMSGHADYKSMKPYIRVTKQHIRSVANKWDI